MEVAVLIISLIVFFFCLYRLGRDDHVLIRKNISMEQLFDIGFLAIVAGLFFSRLIFVLFYPVEGENIFLQFFSPGIADFSLLTVVSGGWIWTYLVGRYKRYPLGRIFDFLSLALVAALPLLGFTRIAVVLSGVYFVLAVVFWKILYPRLISSKLREGILGILFLVSFLVISLSVSLIGYLKGGKFVFAPEGFFLIGVCVLNGIFILRQGRKGQGRR